MSDKPQLLWIWYWQQGGYNSCYAATREEAFAKAKAITKTLTVDEQSLHIGTTKELHRLDAMYC